MRYMPNTREQKEEMLRDIGVTSFEALIEGVPKAVRLGRLLNLPSALCEAELEQRLVAMSRQNGDFFSMRALLGAGLHSHHVPAAVRALVQREEFLTSYTPYQPELSQGTLQSMFEAQTYFSRLSGMEVVVPSLYDGASATAEATLMALRITHRDKVVIASSLHPFYKQTVRTYLAPQGTEVVESAPCEGVIGVERLKEMLGSSVAAVVVQSPNFFGGIEDLQSLADAAHACGSLLVVAVAEAMSLGVLKGPGVDGADIVACDVQSFGLDANFGGPSNAFLATQRKYMRQIPGRIVGETRDVEGKRVFVMTLRAREQDIRRERATSNICSNHGLNVVAGNAYLSLLGTGGLYNLSLLNTRAAHYLEKALIESGRFERVFDYGFYNEFLLRSKSDVHTVKQKLLNAGFVPPLVLSELGYPDDLRQTLLFAATELLSRNDLDEVVDVLSK